MIATENLLQNDKRDWAQSNIQVVIADMGQGEFALYVYSTNPVNVISMATFEANTERAFKLVQDHYKDYTNVTVYKGAPPAACDS